MGYDAVGNVTSASDINTSGGSVMGTWTYAYDTLNRLTAMHNTATTPASIQYANMYGCWAYDDFGNRTANYPLWTTACPAQESSLTPTDTYNTNNQMDVATKSYDPSGNMTADSSTGNTYLYDGEGRICAVASTPVLGFTTMTGYVYDAEGTRVAKGTITTVQSLVSPSNPYGMSCDPSVNGILTANNETDYILGPGGEQVTELAQDANGTMNWQRTYVYAGGLIGTYDPDPDNPSQPLPSFRLTDWLGTLRATTDSYGVAQGTCTGLPFGDGVSCSGDIPDNHHFTGKERDNESGNDYFDARYYSSAMGRWLSPDWSAKEEPVPYAKLDDPQSLNLYVYVLNNPMTLTDPDGHGCHKFLGVTVCIGGPPPLPPPDAQHNHQVTYREVKGVGANVANHLTVQVDGNKEVGFGPKKDSDMTTKEFSKEVVGKSSGVPGTVEGRAVVNGKEVPVLDAVTVHVTAEQAEHAQATIDARGADPGLYQVTTRSCVMFGETVNAASGGKGSTAETPGGFISDVRKQQYKDNSSQTASQ